MLSRSRSWLANISLDDPIERRQAPMIQVILIALLSVSILGLVSAVLTAGPDKSLPFTFARYGPVILFAFGALVFLRRGMFQASVLTITMGLLIVISLSLAATGVRQSDTGLISFMLPVTLAGLLAGRRVLAVIVVLTLAAVIGIHTLEQVGSPLIGFLASHEDPTGVVVGSFVMSTILLTVFFDRFGSSLRNALTTALSREQELEKIRESQAATIETRTASLKEALQAVEQRETHLQETLDELRASQQAVREMSAPVVPVLRGVLVAPLIGALDTDRARELTQNVLGAVTSQHARYVIFDITGVPVVDTQVAQVLLQTTAAVQLLGARALLVGIRPEVAQTIISLGLDMGALTTYPNLQEAIEWLMAQGDLGKALRLNLQKQHSFNGR
jgi:anti-anti-sigma regulatory factor